MNPTQCAIASGETFWWELDVSDKTEHNGRSQSVTSFVCTVEAGSIVIDESSDKRHSRRIEGSVLYFWGDATASPVGDITIVRVTMTMSNGDIVCQWIHFETKER